MIGNLFDSPWKILIVALVIIVLFGSKKLPSAARSLGQSMRILKKEVQGLHEDEPEPRPAGAQPAAQAPPEVTAGASGGPSATAAAAPPGGTGRWSAGRARVDSGQGGQLPGSGGRR